MDGYRGKHLAGRFSLCLFRIVHVGAGDVSASLYAYTARPLSQRTTSPAPETLSMSDLAGKQARESPGVKYKAKIQSLGEKPLMALRSFANLWGSKD